MTTVRTPVESPSIPIASSHLPPVRLLMLVPGVLCALFVAVLYGSVSVAPGAVVHVVMAHLGLPAGAGWSQVDGEIVWQVRLPEVLDALTVGAGLAVAGTLFQAVLRNPLADPYVIGTSSGAALGATIAIVAPITAAWHGLGAIQVLAFTGAFVAVVVVYVVSRVGGQTPIVTLLLAGFAVSTVLIAGMWLLMFMSGQTDQVFRWTMGDLGSSDWGTVSLLVPIMLALIGGTALFVRDLNVMVVGEDQASHLGVDVERVKVLALLLATLITALAVSFSGIIGFVGLVIPHIGRLIYGSNHRLLLPASALLGAMFLVLADLAARTIAAPAIVPLGVLTALIGAPFFVYLLRRSRHAYRF